ncbi:MAG: T9SS type A sorting domain-containing protein [Crocinitomicaceae bacterium]|nr:T9SS type A sorting domain-containing protein [Crocinitomicaceae bacterium]
MKKTFFLIFLSAFIAPNVLSQTVAGTFSTVPCNNDGVLDVTTTGMTPPITYTYYIGSSAPPIIHAGVNSTTDQLTNIPMMNTGYVAVHASDGTNQSWDYPSYTPTFTFWTYGTDAVCPSTMGTLTANQGSGGPGPYNFTWTDTSTLLTYSGSPVSAPMGGYSVLIEDLGGSGCILDLQDSAAFISQTSTITATMSSTPAGCTDGTATAVATGGTAPYTYQWMNGATNSTINNLTQGYYTLTITDAQGCQNSNLGVWVTQNPTISVNATVTDATCLQTDGDIMAFGSGGVPPYTYNWSNGQTGMNATNLAGGNSYTVVVTDANGCTGQGGAWVGTSTPITVTYTASASSCTAPTGSATLAPAGGTPPYTYAWNTNPVQTTQTVSNVPSGSYGFTVTDAVGCVRTGSAWIPPVSSINATLAAANVPCPGTSGNAQMSVTGSNPPFTYLWSNAATTPQITGVPLGGYSCTVTDAVGCSVTKSGSINNVTIMNIGGTVTNVSCLYNSDGAITAQVTGGTAPYTYSWTSGATSATATGLTMGNHWVTVTDVNGCSKSKMFTVGNAATTTDCYCTIEGTVYLDDNNNCTLDGGEAGIHNIMVHCSGQGYVFTDANGYYSFQVPTGTYTITEQVNAYYPLQTCQSTSTTVSVVAAVGCTSTVDIANDMNTINDLKLTTVSGWMPPVPGNTYTQKVIVNNMGTVTENDVQMGYEHDGQLTYLNSTLPSFMQTGGPTHYSVSNSYPTLVPGATNMMLLTYDVATNIPAGTELDFYDSVAHVAPIDVNWLLDYSPWNNVNHYEPIVVASYDPNYKEVHPSGLGPEGFISSQVTEFDYTIHFQNEGTYYAQNIYIKDQLDADLDWTTLSPGYSDYSYTTTVSETGEVTFTFANINLPWKSQFGDALSSGLVNFSIKRKDSVPQGTEFTNYADIYFDYNPPITTNTVINTLDDGEFNSVEEPVIEDDLDAISVDVYPVPAYDMITFRVNNVSKDEVATLYVMDLTGKVVKSEKIILGEGTNFVNQNVSELATGNYLTKIEFDSGLFIVNKIVLF